MPGFYVLPEPDTSEAALERFYTMGAPACHENAYDTHAYAHGALPEQQLHCYSCREEIRDTRFAVKTPEGWICEDCI